MAKGIYVGVNGVARKVKAQYVGVSGVARKVTKGYVGVGGVARNVFTGRPEFFTAALTASFTTRTGGSYSSNCSLMFRDLGDQYGATGTLPVQNGTLNCDSIQVSGVPAEIRSEFPAMTINGHNASVSGSDYIIRPATAVVSVNTTSASLSLTLAADSGAV